MSKPKINYQSHLVTVSAAGAAKVGDVDYTGLDQKFDNDFEKVTGAYIIPIDNGGLTYYGVKLQHKQIADREATHFDDWKSSTAVAYKDRFRPLDLDGKGAGFQVKVNVPKGQILAIGLSVSFHIIFRIENTSEQ